MMRGLTRRQLLRSALSWTVAAAGSQLRSIRAIETFAADISERERAAMTRIAEAFRTQFGIPGLAVAIARHGQSVYDEAFGVANRERGEALTSSHQFRIASVSKPITSCAIFDLIETRQLSLDDRVFGRGGLLGTRFGRQPYGRFVEDITVEHLLTHTCGGWRNDGSDPMFSHPAMSHGELI
jgi:CubicO group peptidase (beta-lactamase class C family)